MRSVSSQDADIKQYISRVRQLEDDVAQKRAASDSDSTNSSLAEENTVLKMELSHLKSQVKETHVNGPTLADDSNNSKEVANLQREVAQLKKSLEKEQKAQKQPAKDSSASNAKVCPLAVQVIVLQSGLADADYYSCHRLTSDLTGKLPMAGSSMLHAVFGPCL